MLLIDDILQVDEARAVSYSKVKADWPLSDGKEVSPMVIIELVAQTAGLSNGLSRLRTQGEEADKRGWLVGIRKADFFVDALSVGTSIVTEAANRFAFEGFREISGESRIGDRVVGEVILQVLQADENKTQPESEHEGSKAGE
jgi:predicted hotdog family 3-hydroxylacyl-ACP dehydratase